MKIYHIGHTRVVNSEQWKWFIAVNILPVDRKKCQLIIGSGNLRVSTCNCVGGNWWMVVLLDLGKISFIYLHSTLNYYILQLKEIRYKDVTLIHLSFNFVFIYQCLICRAWISKNLCCRYVQNSFYLSFISFNLK